MIKLQFGSVPSTLEGKIDWCIKALNEIQRSSHDLDAFSIADGFTVTNLTKDRSFNADTVNVAELADIVGTLIQDMKDRGPKRT